MSGTLNRFLEVTGSPHAMALQQGKKFKDSWDDILLSLREVPLLPMNLQEKIPLSFYRYFIRSAGKKYLARHQSLLGSYRHGAFMEKLRGLGEGLGRSLEDTYGINAFEIDAAKVFFTMGCTALAFDSQHTDSQRPKLGYNHDFPESFRHLLFVRKSVPTKGFACLSLTYPTLIGAVAGINENGLAVTLNHAFANDFQNQAGVPITFLVQECLEHCKTTQEAMDLIGDVAVPNGSMINVVDKSGNRAVMELACQKRAIRSAQSEIMYTFNHYRVEEMWKSEVPLEAKATGLTKIFLKGRGIHEHNIQRENRFRKILDPKKRYSDSDIRSLLCDHGSSMEKVRGDYHTICRHHPNTMSTIASVIMDPGIGKMKVSFGNPCRENWTEYSLNDSL